MTSFDKVLREVRKRGADEARADGSEKVEAQHLLLAIAAYPDTAVQRVLESAGLNRDADSRCTRPGVRAQPECGRSIADRV